MSAAERGLPSVAEIMDRAPLAVASDALAVDAERLAVGRRRHHLLVSYDNALIGIVCLCELRAAQAGAHVGDCMTRPALAVAVHVAIERAADIMIERKLDCLPVLHGGVVAGLITRADLVRAGALPPASPRCMRGDPTPPRGVRWES